ncbi:MAG TPA: hypothetical protein VL282_18750 [Tepidisphaeraceae bacterium]|jgi:hypothetical protein|nr:hypothetical protein [Tepidisphaeraceae bacterium]
MADEKVQKLSPLKWLAGIVVFLIVLVGCAGLGLWLRPPAQSVTATPDIFQSIAIIFIGVVLAFLGAALYGLTLLTHGFIFRFDRPIFRGLGAKLWLLNLIVGLLLASGFSFVVAPSLSTVLSRFFPTQIAAIAGFFIPFFAAQLFCIWFQIWAPLERSIITRRVLGLGILPEEVSRGVPIGISDPSKNSFKKMTLIEEDIGMLWFNPNELVYRGDSIAYNFRPLQVLAVERRADAGSTSSYFGAVHVILHYRGEDGQDYRVRFHTEGDWTLTAKARALNALADRLNSWKMTYSPPPLPLATQA